MKSNSVEKQIAQFLAKYPATIAAQLSAARGKLSSLFPRGFELVFDNYNALVFAFAATERSADAFVSVAGYPKWITLFFRPGAGLRDPHKLLQGEGKLIRSIRLKSADDIDTPEVQAIIKQAIDRHRAALRIAPPISTVVKAEMAKQRSRRPPPKARESKPRVRKTASRKTSAKKIAKRS